MDGELKLNYGCPRILLVTFMPLLPFVEMSRDVFVLSLDFLLMIVLEFILVLLL